ncbi:1-alkyl-2-acetylglycerophosphocholine esterase [Durusdinium trenchii]|uniref:1-alkyl-2-acetylglycerophosphocholine esterase n=1 Tax=Durusdinium trenchii TaxID=1381693 RepID=A0ABP0I1Z9_9DINO
MQPPSNTGGSIPLQEYRRDVPPGWTPGDPSYPLRSYFEKMRLWYRVSNVEDESVGPLLAGRLYGRAAKVAMTLKVPRPDGRFDTGDAALARLSVEEVQDPTTGAIIQHAIPSGVQFLVDALRRAFGQQDQDLATEALEKFFSLTRGKLSLAEYAVEFDTRLDEAADRAGLQLNDVAKFFLWFKHSGMSVKVIDDIKLQVGGDYTRFQDARALALRMSPNRSDATNDPTVFYGDVKDESYGDSYVYHQDTWDQEQDMWYGYEDAEEGEWIYETDENYFQDWSEDPDGWQSFYEDGEDWTAEEPWSVSQDYEKPSASDASPVDAATEQESFYKGKGKPKDGCFNCGSKWHQVRDCPMKSEKGKGYAYQSKGKYGKGKGFRGRWTWRPSSWKGKGKGKSKYGFRGGYKGKGKKGHWFVAEPLSERTLNVQDGNIHVLGNTPRLDQNHGPPHESFVIHSSSEDDIMKVRRPYVAAVNAEATSSEEPASTSTSRQPKTLDTTTWNFMFLAGEACSYFQVRGQERKGLLIDPGAASGLVGSETLRMLLKDCAVGEPQFEYDKKTPVSGISGTSSSTLGQVTVPLRVGSLPITYTAEVLGGEGSLCPALVGNPTLRKLNATIFANWFDNGDGLMTMDGRQDEGIVNIKFFRLLLTESGHYILPTDDKEKHKTHYLDKNKAILFCQKAALATAKRYEDLHPRVHHCFLGRTLPQARAEGDRCENEKENEADKKDMTKHMALHAVQERPCPHQEEDNEQKMQDSHHAAQEPHDAAQPLAQAVREENDKVHHSQDHNAAGLPILDSQPQTADDQYHTCKQIHEEGNPMPADLTPSAILANSTTTDDRYVQDVLPAEHDHLDVLKLNKRYKAIPEEYYSKSGLTPVTPGNFKAWFSKTRGRGLRWHAWELCSGSGRLSLCLLMAGLGLVVGFPVDYRYGWDINNAQHQSYLDMAYHEFQPGMVHASPDCAPWSISSNSRDPELRHQDRLRDRPGLHWLRGVFEKQDKQNRGYNLEQPQTSAMWQEHLPENPMKLSFIKGNRKRQRVDQCMHGACDECRNPIKKSTGFGSNIRWNRCALRCSGHRGQAHSHLQGTGPDGLSRTSSAAVYPQTLCQRMKNDIIGYLTRKDLLDIGKWPDDCYHTVITHMYECIRCQLGRGCPKSIEHTLIPGQCRHGKWPPGESPKEKAKADADPLLRWKTEVSKEILDTVEIRNISSYGGFSVEDMHFLKKLLMEVVHSALGIFDEAVQQKKEYLHWITDPVHMSLFKEIFGGMLVVKGVKISLRPFTDGTAEPHLPMISSYLRLHVYGTVKDWKIMPLHDLREMSHSQIHQAIDIDDWLITIYGVETAAVPAPSTPASRPRAIPPEAPLPPKAESLSLPRLMDRPLNEKEEVAIIEPVYEDAELATQKIMKYTESLSSYKPILHGWVTDKMNRWIRLPKDNATAIKVMQWATDAYSMLDRADCHGCILGKALRHLQPPRGTIGHLITWIHGGVNYAIQEHNSDNNMIMKKITNYAREDICIMYLYRYAPKSSEDLERSPQKTTTSSPQPMQVTSTPQEQEDSEDMEVEHHGEKRDGPDSRTVTFAPERKRQKLMLVKKDLEFLRHYFIATNKDRLVQLDFPENWKTDYNLMMNTTRKFLVKQYDERRRNLPELFHLEYKQNHFAYANLRTGLVKMYGVENHPIVARVLPTARDFSENDLHKEDKELYDKFGAQAEASFASFLLGLICKNKMTMFALMMASAAQAQKPEESNSSEISDDMWSIYFLILYTVMVAVGVQLVMNWMFKKREKTAPRVAVKKESSDDDMMEVDFEMSKNRKRKSEHSGTEDVEKLQAKINGYEDLVEKLNRLNENNKTSADDWYRRYQDAKDNMDSLRAERDDARNDRDQQRAMLRQQYEKEQDLRDQLNNTEIQLQTEKERLDGMKKAYDLVTKREHDLEKKLQETERDLRMSRMAPSLPAPKTPQSVVEEKKMPDKIFTTAVDEPRPPAAEPHRETKEEMRQETIWMVAQEDRFKERQERQERQERLAADDEEEDFFPGLSVEANRGFGRGRPMGRFLEGPFLGRGMGRGRALAPPPGLQGLQLSGSQRLPGSLSRPWMAGPPIPEDEDVTTPQMTWVDPQNRWSVPSLDLPGARRAWADMDSGSEMSFSEQKGQMSYVTTPKQKWSKTPSPPSSPAAVPCLQLRAARRIEFLAILIVSPCSAGLALCHLCHGQLAEGARTDRLCDPGVRDGTHRHGEVLPTLRETLCRDAEPGCTWRLKLQMRFEAAASLQESAVQAVW